MVNTVNAAPQDPLPPELRTHPPRPLPRWARRRTYPILVFAASVACIGVALFLFPEAGVRSLIPAVIGFALGGIGWRALATRRILASGDGVAAGVVTETGTSKGSFWASYEFPTATGRRTGTAAFQSMIVVDDFGIRPEAGDSVYVVYDSRDPSRNAAWGFALPPGQRRDLHWSDRPMPRWLIVLLVTATIAAALAAASSMIRSFAR